MNLITPPKAGKARAPASFGEREGLRGLYLGPMCPSLPDHEVKTKDRRIAPSSSGPASPSLTGSLNTIVHTRCLLPYGSGSWSC